MMKQALSVAALLAFGAGGALAQSTGASPADPNNERNQRPAMSNPQPADPGTDTPAARVPTDPEDAGSAAGEEGGATGESTGESGAAEPSLDEPALDPEDPATPPQAEP